MAELTKQLQALKVLPSRQPGRRKAGAGVIVLCTRMARAAVAEGAVS
jgi:hypothetical protein